jgi:hypothetical protein
MYWTKATGWESRNLTADVSLTFSPGSLTSFSNLQAITRIAGLTTDGDVVLFQFTGSGVASMTNLTDTIVGAPTLTGSLVFAPTRVSKGMAIIGVDAGGKVIRYSVDPGSPWGIVDVTSAVV